MKSRSRSARNITYTVRAADLGAPSAAQEGNAPLGALYDSHLAQFRARLCRRFVRHGGINRLSADDIDDAIHEAFARMLRVQHSGEVEIRSPAAYVLAAARNFCVDMLRSQTVRSNDDVDSSAPGEQPDNRDEAELSAALALLESYLERLPEELATVFSLRFISGLSQRDCAAALAMSRKRVRRLEALSIERLRAHVVSPRSGEVSRGGDDDDDERLDGTLGVENQRRFTS